MKSILVTSIVSCVLILSACENQSEEIVPASASFIVEFSPGGNSSHLMETTTDEERQVLLRKTVEVMAGQEGEYGNIAQLLRAPIPLSEKDHVVFAILDEYQGVEWEYLRQTVAHPMLELHLRNGSGDLDAISRYARVLVETETPSADLMVEALPLLEDRWSKSERTKAARVAMAASEKWVQKSCPDCSARRSTASIVSAQEDNDMQLRAQAIQEATPALESFIEQ